jgi:hypothetical protein
MVLDVSNPNRPVLYASSAIDITQDVISLYDETSSAGGPATGVTTPPAGTTAPSCTKTSRRGRGKNAAVARGAEASNRCPADWLEQVSTATPCSCA